MPGQPAAIRDNSHIRDIEWDKYQLGFIWEEIHLISLDGARKYWCESISANQNAPCRTFVQVNRAGSTNLRSCGKFSSHFTEIPPCSKWDLT